MRASFPPLPGPEDRPESPDRSGQPPTPVPEPEEYAQIPGLFVPEDGSENFGDGPDGPDDGAPQPPAAPSSGDDPDAVARLVPVPVRVVDESGDRLEIQTMRLRHRLLTTGVEHAERMVAWHGVRDSVLEQLPPELSATVPDLFPPPADLDLSSEPGDEEEHLSDSGSAQESDIVLADQHLLDAVTGLDGSTDRDEFDTQLAVLTEHLALRNVRPGDVPAVVAYLGKIAARGDSANVAYDASVLVDRALEHQTYTVLSAEHAEAGSIDHSVLRQARDDYRRLATLASEIVRDSAAEIVGEEPEAVRHLEQRLIERVQSVDKLSMADLSPKDRDRVLALLEQGVRESDHTRLHGVVQSPTARVWDRTFAGLAELTDEQPTSSPREASAPPEFSDLDFSAFDMAQPAPEPTPATAHIGVDGKYQGVRVPIHIPVRKDSKDPDLVTSLARGELELLIPRCASEADGARALQDQLLTTARQISSQKIVLEGMRVAYDGTNVADTVPITTETGELVYVQQAYVEFPPDPDSDQPRQVPMPELPEAVEKLTGKAQELMMMRERLAPVASGTALPGTYEGVLQDVLGVLVQTSGESIALAEEDLRLAAENELIGFVEKQDPVRLMMAREVLALSYREDIRHVTDCARTIARYHAGEADKSSAMDAADSLVTRVDSMSEDYAEVRESGEPLLAPAAELLRDQEEQLIRIAEQTLRADRKPAQSVRMSAERANSALEALAALGQPEHNPFLRLDNASFAAQVNRALDHRPLTDEELAARPPRAGVPYVPGSTPPTLSVELPYLTVEERRSGVSLREQARRGRAYRYREVSSLDPREKEALVLREVDTNIPLDEGPTVVIEQVEFGLTHYRDQLDRAKADREDVGSTAVDEAAAFDARQRQELDRVLPILAELPRTVDGAVAALKHCEAFREEAVRGIIGTTAADALARQVTTQVREHYGQFPRRSARQSQAQNEEDVANAAVHADQALAVYHASLAELEEQVRVSADAVKGEGAEVSVDGDRWERLVAVLEDLNGMRGWLQHHLSSALEPMRQSADNGLAMALKHAKSGKGRLTEQQLNEIATALHDYQLHLPFKPLGDNIGLTSIAAEFLRRDDGGDTSPPKGGIGPTPGSPSGWPPIPGPPHPRPNSPRPRF